MAEDNKIQLDIEINQSSVEGSFGQVDKRATKSAKESAAVFGEAFQRQEQDLKSSIERIVGETRKVAERSAKESAQVFQDAFTKQEQVYKASVKQNLDNAIKALTGGDQIKKSAAESASVFEEFFAKEAKSFTPIETPVEGPSPFAIKSFTDLAAAGLVAGQVLKAVGEAAKFTIDTIKQGEAEFRLEARFKLLAESAGIAADALNVDLKKAVNGLVDDSELLQSASEAFIKLGDNAKQLPQILELARKASITFGGSITENTDKITQAIFSQQTRQLKGIGIQLDVNKTLKDYALELGTVPALLTESQKQQALLNETLRQGEARFRNVKTEVGATEAYGQLGVAFKNLNDEFSKLASSRLGGFFQSLALSAKAAVDSIAEVTKNLQPVQTVERAQGQIDQLQEKIKNYSNELANLGTAANTAIGANFKAGIIEAQRSIAEYEKLVVDLKAKQDQALANREPSGVGGGDSAVSEEFLRRRTELNNKLLELNAQRGASDLALAQQEFSVNQTRANLEAIYYQQRLSAANKYEQDKANLEKFFTENGVVDESLRFQAREALEQTHLNNLLLLQQGYATQKKTVEDASNLSTFNSALQIQKALTATATATAKTGLTISNVFKDIASVSKAALAEGAGRAFAAFGAALVQSGNSAAEFGKAFLSIIGGVLQQLGQGYILQGIAISANPLTPGAGSGLITAGVALSVFGGALGALGSGGGFGGPGTGGGTTGGVASTPSEPISPINQAPEPEETAPEAAKTNINLTINGNVLDRRETGLEIAQILEEQFAEQGLTIRGAS